jgi:hypothetical protein
MAFYTAKIIPSFPQGIMKAQSSTVCQTSLNLIFSQIIGINYHYMNRSQKYTDAYPEFLITI